MRFSGQVQVYSELQLANSGKVHHQVNVNKSTPTLFYVWKKAPSLSKIMHCSNNNSVKKIYKCIDYLIKVSIEFHFEH